MLPWKYIFWVCACTLSYPACKAHSSYYLCSLSGIYIFYLYYLINSMFKKKKVIKQKMYVLIYSTTLSEIFLTLKRIQWHTTINIHWSSYKVPLFLSDFNQNWIFFDRFKKKLKYKISWKSTQKEFICSVQMDKQTIVTKLTVTSRNFTNAPRNWLANCLSNYLHGLESFFRNQQFLQPMSKLHITYYQSTLFPQCDSPPPIQQILIFVSSDS